MTEQEFINRLAAMKAKEVLYRQMLAEFVKVTKKFAILPEIGAIRKTVLETILVIDKEERKIK